ncbi:hypothetical protein [Nocardioides limicola]|uniref:hypothetical protein n=1 Tax=Nocardioides limicola TaxID=2803368 RepID=UPI001EF07917|nr:hypothetical protein [Nocardioides sp. DJM-14]
MIRAATLVGVVVGTLFPVAASTAVPVSVTVPRCAGISVVVDATPLAGERVVRCVESTEPLLAGAAFTEAGFSLERVRRLPGAVCRIDGLPADLACVNMPPADGYWKLYWAPADADWSYASLGVDSLEIPVGGAVGFSWPGAEPSLATSTGEDAEEGDDGGVPDAVVWAGIAVVLGALALLIQLRRRRP